MLIGIWFYIRIVGIIRAKKYGHTDDLSLQKIFGDDFVN